MRTDADGDRFLADVGVAGTVDQAALMAAGQLLLALPDELHGAVEGEEGSGEWAVGSGEWGIVECVIGFHPSLGSPSSCS